jgi:trimeric autotransporter adhesin
MAKYKTKIQADAGVAITSETASKALQLDSSGNVQSSVTTSTELAQLHGITSGVVSLNDTQTLTNKTLTSPAITSPTGITKSDVGLNNVDNTSDVNKPVSTATQTALNLLVPYTGATSNLNLGTHSISASNVSGTTSGTNTGDLTLNAVDSTPNANGASLSGQALTLQPANGSFPGLLTATAQTIGGAKTFSSAVAMSSNKITGLASGTVSGDALHWGQIGVVNGIAGLDGSGKVPLSQLPSTLMEFQGNWNPTTNTPTLVDGTGTTGYTYWVSAAKSTAVSGLTDPSMVNFQIGDLVIYNGTKWVLVTPAAGVQSVNGQQGAITINAINQLTSDVTTSAASGSQSLSATVASVGGSTAALVHSAELLANAATNLNTVSTIVKRDASGNFSAGTITAALSGNATTATSFTGSLSGDVTGTQGATSISAATVTGKAITGFVSGAGTVTASDTILTAINKLNGNIGSIGAPGVGDIGLSTFAAANNISTATAVTGFAFAAGTVRSFRALASVAISATSPLYEVFDIIGIQNASGFSISVQSNGDNSGVVFSITSAGQVNYTSTNVTGWTANKISYRAQVTNV